MFHNFKLILWICFQVKLKKFSAILIGRISFSKYVHIFELKLICRIFYTSKLYYPLIESSIFAIKWNYI